MNKTLSSKRLWLGLAFLALGLVLLSAYLYEINLAPESTDTGTDFGLEGNAVRVSLTFSPKKLTPGDSLDVDIKLVDIPGVAPGVLPPGIANESGGTLSGVLSAPDDCKVAPREPIVLPTSGLELSEMEWHWVVDCSTEGRKTFLPTISFAKNGRVPVPGTADAIAYRGTISISVSKSLTQTILGLLSAAFLSVIGAVVTYALQRRKNQGSQA